MNKKSIHDLNLIDYYKQQCSQQNIIEDAQQLVVLTHLQIIALQLTIAAKSWSRFLTAIKLSKPILGLYVWGNVGTGKTLLLDYFYQALPFPKKKRIHFYAFMQMIHAELRKLQGKKNPLQILARKLSRRYRVICFDELFVIDIVDAMLLGNLLSALFSRGVCLIATSNVKPDDLYKNGLQRRSFLPAIEMLKKHMTVLHIPTTIDYRARTLKAADIFYTPHNEIAEQKMQALFTMLCQGQLIHHKPLIVNGRPIPVKKQASDVIWFDFKVICNVPRSQDDYISITKQFHTVFISNIPVIAAENLNIIALFIRMIDIFYDAKTKIVFSAACPVNEIYTSGEKIFEYARTCSRLIEMQSENYQNQV